MYIYLKYSKHGYEISVVGESERTARYVGIKVEKVVIRTMLLSGAICGLAGFIAVAGSSHTISTSTAGGRGFTAIIVAWLAQLNTAAIFVVSALICVLHYGSTVAAATFSQVDSSFANMLQGAILFLVLAADFFIRFRVVMDKKGGK